MTTTWDKISKLGKEFRDPKIVKAEEELEKYYQNLKDSQKEYEEVLKKQALSKKIEQKKPIIKKKKIIPPVTYPELFELPPLKDTTIVNFASYCYNWLEEGHFCGNYVETENHIKKLEAEKQRKIKIKKFKENEILQEKEWKLQQQQDLKAKKLIEQKKHEKKQFREKYLKKSKDYQEKMKDLHKTKKTLPTKQSKKDLPLPSHFRPGGKYNKDRYDKETKTFKVPMSDPKKRKADSSTEKTKDEVPKGTEGAPGASAGAGTAMGSGAALEPHIADQTMDSKFGINKFYTSHYEGTMYLEENGGTDINKWYYLNFQFPLPFIMCESFMQNVRKFEYWRCHGFELHINNITQCGMQSDNTYMGSTTNSRVLFYRDGENLFSDGTTIGWNDTDNDSDVIKGWLGPSFDNINSGLIGTGTGLCTPPTCTMAGTPLDNFLNIRQRDPRVHQLACNAGIEIHEEVDLEPDAYRRTHEWLCQTWDKNKPAFGGSAGQKTNINTSMYRADNIWTRLVHPYVSQESGNLKDKTNMNSSDCTECWYTQSNNTYNENPKPHYIETPSTLEKLPDYQNFMNWSVPHWPKSRIPIFLIKIADQVGQSKNVIGQRVQLDYYVKYYFEFYGKKYETRNLIKKTKFYEPVPYNWAFKCEPDRMFLVPCYPQYKSGTANITGLTPATLLDNLSKTGAFTQPAEPGNRQPALQITKQNDEEDPGY